LHAFHKHRKIRFRRAEIADLAAQPSAAGQRAHWRFEKARRSLARAAFFGLAGVLAVVVLVAVGAFALLSSDWGPDTVRSRAEQAVAALTRGRATATIGTVRLEPGIARPVVLHLDDVALKDPTTNASILTAASIDFGVRIVPLAYGQLQLSSAEISGARIDLGALPSSDGSDWMAPMRDARGLIDPDLVTATVFKALHPLFDATEAGVVGQVILDDVQLRLPGNGRVRQITLSRGVLERQEDGALAVTVEGEAAGRPIRLVGTTERDSQSKRVRDLALSLDVGEPGSAEPEQPASAGRLGAFSISAKGAEAVDGTAGKLALNAVLERSVFDLGARGKIEGDLSIDAAIETGTHKVEVGRLLVRSGRTSLEFNGAIGPRPDEVEPPASPPTYRFEMVSTRTVAAPEGSTEDPLPFQVQVRGNVDPEAGTIVTDSLALKSSGGNVVGTARVELVAGLAPGIAFALSGRDLPVAHAKNLWPWFSAGKARDWVYGHVFGGTVKQADVEFRVLPGRLGDGVPLSGEEVSARFDLEGVRFDTAGALPPIRDADGTVVVRGRDVDVTLRSGTAYLPSGRTVAASKGTLAVRPTGVPPLIGKLDIDVAGEAAAVAELASFEPINALRRVAFAPDDLKGTVEGHIIADVPLQPGVSAKDLEWIVALDYKGLSIAKPFGDQTLSNADGHATIEPTQAVISATGQLNGLPARIELTEPFGDAGAKRVREIELVLDDKARQKVAPGLNALLSGPVKVQVDERDGKRAIVADLTDAKLDIPWVGWAKGAGIGATAAFTAVANGGKMDISDFKLSGKSFDVRGTMTVADGKLQSARFDKVMLNRGDDVRVDVDRSGKGYNVAVAGSSLDARSLIKSFLSGSGKAGDGQAKRDAVSVAIDIDSVTGFGSETLNGLKMKYGASAGGATDLSMNARQRSGGGLAVTDGTVGGRRQLVVQAEDAGAVLRLLDLYGNMQGGTLKIALAGARDGSLAGQVDARDFWLVDEPRLASIVSTRAAGGDRSLGEAAGKQIDTSRVSFERGFAQIARGEGYLKIANGVVRGATIGTTFQGTVYDPNGQMDMTGTFMPAYGINRIFGEMPVLGALLGNGRDRGLIGVTFKLDGPAKSPRLQVNPLSVMAPGIFRGIFEFD
jgi:hypothetical protein